jgi:hypothetical protein
MTTPVTAHYTFTVGTIPVRENGQYSDVINKTSCFLFYIRFSLGEPSGCMAPRIIRTFSLPRLENSFQYIGFLPDAYTARMAPIFVVVVPGFQLDPQRWLTPPTQPSFRVARNTRLDHSTRHGPLRPLWVPSIPTSQNMELGTNIWSSPALAPPPSIGVFGNH